MAQRRSILSSKTSRDALPKGDKPEWEVIGPGVRLGYRRGRGTRGLGGSWLVASRSFDGTRQQSKLARADDALPADGVAILDHEQAKTAARSWAKSIKAGERITAALTVNQVLDQYLAARESEGMKSINEARRRAAFSIRTKLGHRLVAELTIANVRAWRDGLVTAQKRLRTARYADKPNVLVVDLKDPEVIRRRRDTANRTLTTLKAALNWAYNNRLVTDDTAWRLVKPYRSTGSARIRFLSEGEQKLVLAASNGSIRDLISAALVTGARFSELARLTVADYDHENRSVFISESKSGKPRHVPLPPGGADLFSRLTGDRRSNEPLLRQDDGSRWKPSAYNRSWRAILSRSGVGNATFHELRHTYASTMVRKGAPLMVVAQALGHADTRMVDKHYAHLAPSYVADTIRRMAPDI